MKKAYTKPEIIFESFVLNTNIAGDCQVIVNTQTEGQCGYLPDRDPTGIHIFTEGIGGCVRTEADDGNNGVCYHVPGDAPDLFNS